MEIREGQLTEEFDRYPYEEVESQSFSLMFEEESKWGRKGEGRRRGRRDREGEEGGRVGREEKEEGG